VNVTTGVDYDAYVKDFFCLGPWAVIDGFTGSVWINVEHRIQAQIVAYAMSAKLNAVVIDISEAVNGQNNLIDSSVALDWSLEINDQIYISGLPSSLNCTKDLTKYHAKGLNLINEAGATSLSRQQRQGLQKEIFFLLALIRHMWPDTGWWGADIPAEHMPFLEKILECFAIEQTLPHITQRLFDTCQQEMHNETRKCLQLLWWLQRFYE